MRLSYLLRRRWGSRLGALAIAVAAAFAAASVPAGAAVVVGGGGDGGTGGDGGGVNPCTNATGTLKLSPTTVLLGQPVVASWSTTPSSCGGATSALVGPGISATGSVVAGVGGSATVMPSTLGANTYSVTAFYPGGSMTVAWASVMVQPDPRSAVQTVYPPADVMLPPLAAPLASVQLSLRQGETRRLFGSLDAYSTAVTVATEMAADVQCTDASDPTNAAIGYHGLAAKNYVGPGDTFLSPRTLFTAPHTGTFTCAMNAYAENAGVIARAASTYLRWDSSDDVSAGYLNARPCGSNGNWQWCQYLGQPTDGTPGVSQAYALDATGTDPTQGWTAAPTANAVNVDATLGLTHCYKSSSCIPKYKTSVSGAASTVSTRMDVIQRNAFGGICNITQTNTFTTTFADEHHFGISYSLYGVPVLTWCGSRVFSVRISVSILSGNDVKIDGSVPYDHDGSCTTGTPPVGQPCSTTGTVPLPSSTGDTRTHAMIVNAAPADRGALAAATDATGKLELFDAVGGQLLYSTQTSAGSSTWSGWGDFSDPNVAALTSLAAATDNAGNIEVMGLDDAGHIWHRWQTSQATWSPWTAVDGLLDSVALVNDNAGLLELFGTNAQGQTFHRTLTSTGTNQWSNWDQITGIAGLHSIAAAKDADGRLEAMAADSQGNTFLRWQTSPGGPWSIWAPWGGITNQLSMVADGGDGHLEVLGTTPGGVVSQIFQLAANGATGWSTWNNGFGSGLTNVTTARNLDGRVQAFATTPTGQVSTSSQILTGGWTTWQQI